MREFRVIMERRSFAKGAPAASIEARRPLSPCNW
jgi:hypothetical protein